MDQAVVPALVAVVVALLLAGYLTLRSWRGHRATVRRLAAVSSRLERGAGGDLEARGGLEKSLARLERAVDEGALRNAEATGEAERLAAVLRHVQQGVVVCDEHGAVVHRNDRATALAGGRNADVLAERAVLESLEDALEGGADSKVIELFGPPRRILSITAAPLDDGRRGLGAVALIDDITDLRKLEAVRRDFVANVSHELKTPVGAVGLLAETLVSETDPSVAKRLAERMQLEAIRVGRIIDDLLDLSRIEAEESPLRDPVPVHLVVADALERVRSMAEHRQIRLEQTEAPRRLTILGNRRQLVSAVNNLLENAVKYSDAGGSVEVSARLNGSWVEIVVRDHGIGIPARDLERIFERFYRVDRARARDTGGTGLGLAIVRHVVNSHGGDVRVASKEGEGSIFTLRLPAGPGSLAVLEATEAEAG